MDIYVGNLPPDIIANDLRALFEKFGDVTDVRLVMGKSRGKTKNYGFIEMPSQEEAEKAIEDMDGTELKEMTLTVKQANPKKPHKRKSGKKRGRSKHSISKRRGVYGGEDRPGFGNSAPPRRPRR
jgi:RNA recognition motif-containing protein